MEAVGAAPGNRCYIGSPKHIPWVVTQASPLRDIGSPGVTFNKRGMVDDYISVNDRLPKVQKKYQIIGNVGNETQEGVGLFTPDWGWWHDHPGKAKVTHWKELPKRD